tara:strand:+ start:1271 stop:1837 length:567 start_codon:yes stop_codon:yes gene_type:complete
MNVEYYNHIAIYKDILPKKWCEKVIELYESKDEKFPRQKVELIPTILKKDTHVSTNTFPQEIIQPFINLLYSKIIPDYDEQYSFNFEKNFQLEVIDFKVQKTNPSEGYHMWHYENSHPKLINRLLVYTAYLNDIEKGGETEFLHQSYRSDPKQGNILIFPAGFTHFHRGNPPMSGSKYIVTGWIITKN